jgi:hypothetical protein
MIIKSIVRRMRTPIALGDAVAAVAQPAAKAIDAVAGTNLAGCGGCQQRQADWNAAAANINPFARPDSGAETPPTPPDTAPDRSAGGA